MIGRVTLDLILRIVGGGAVCMPLIVEIASVDLLDRPANVPAKRYKAVPTASSECYFLRFPVLPASFGARWAT
jgi:hypothetical protein